MRVLLPREVQNSGALPHRALLQLLLLLRARVDSVQGEARVLRAFSPLQFCLVSPNDTFDVPKVGFRRVNVPALEPVVPPEQGSVLRVLAGLQVHGKEVPVVDACRAGDIGVEVCGRFDRDLRVTSVLQAEQKVPGRASPRLREINKISAGNSDKFEVVG